MFYTFSLSSVTLCCMLSGHTCKILSRTELCHTECMIEDNGQHEKLDDLKY